MPLEATPEGSPLERAASSAAVVSELEEVAFEGVASTAMFATLGRVRALLVAEVPDAIVRNGLAEARGYGASDLWAIAEVGYHYLRSGGYRLAAVIFEGLAALQPDEPYHQLALGLAQDHLGEEAAARAAYEKALRLDPADPRPELNLAELSLAGGDHVRAQVLLGRARAKALARGDTVLARKATALLGLSPRETALASRPRGRRADERSAVSSSTQEDA
jgi:tetratricopeptide (TPR) repeat protein